MTELVTLAEEDELQEVTIDDFVENSKSAFTILLEDNKSLEVKIIFMSKEKSETNTFKNFMIFFHYVSEMGRVCREQRRKATAVYI